MDTRAARRAAEKAARDLMTSRAAVVGELGVAQAERARLVDDVAAAYARGRELVATAEAEAGRLVTAAQNLVGDAEQRYADVYSAATGAGWASADLSALGFQPAAGGSPRRRRVAAQQPTLVPTSEAPLSLPEELAGPGRELVPEP